MTYLLPQTPSGGGITLQGAWKFSTNTAATDPGNKSFKINTGSLAAATNIYINETTDNNADASNILGVLAQGNRIYIQQQDDSSRAALFEISGAPVDNGSWWTIPVTVVSSLTIWQNNRTCGFVLDLSAAGGGGSNIQTQAVQDMAGIAIVGGGVIADCKGFRCDIWDLNMDGNGERPTLRLNDGTLHTTGYNQQKFDKDHNATYIADALVSQVAGTWFDPNNLANLGIVYGYWEGRLMDPATNLWSIYGKFRDTFSGDLNRIEVFGDVAIDAPLVGLQVQSGNASTWSAGSYGQQSWS